MEVLLSKLLEKRDHQIQLLTSPKYHCELVGEGVDYVSGLAKKYYHSIGIGEKRTKEKFEKCVREAIEIVRKEYVERLLAKCRRLMMAYNAFDKKKKIHLPLKLDFSKLFVFSMLNYDFFFIMQEMEKTFFEVYFIYHDINLTNNIDL